MKKPLSAAFQDTDSGWELIKLLGWSDNTSLLLVVSRRDGGTNKLDGVWVNLHRLVEQ